MMTYKTRVPTNYLERWCWSQTVISTSRQQLQSTKVLALHATIRLECKSQVKQIWFWNCLLSWPGNPLSMCYGPRNSSDILSQVASGELVVSRLVKSYESRSRVSNASFQGFRVLVQSDRHPEYLDSRIEAFLDSLGKTIEEMSEEEFEKNKTALAVKRLEKPKKLYTRTAKFWQVLYFFKWEFKYVIIY